MKGYGISILLLISSLTGFAAVVRWDGEAGNGLWSSAMNWSGNFIPGSSDDVILDNTFIGTGFTVTMPSGTVVTTLRSFSISPTSPNAINVILPSSNTAAPALIIVGIGDAFVLDNGAIFRNMSGALSGATIELTAANFFRINNGGHYIHNTLRAHADMVARLSTSMGTELGIFEFDIPSSSPQNISISGRSYGTLRLSSTSAGVPVTYRGQGSQQLDVNGNFELGLQTKFEYYNDIDTIIIRRDCKLEAGSELDISTHTNNAVVQLHGNLVNNGIITESGSSTGSTFEFVGVLQQQASGEFTNDLTVKLNNGAGLWLSGEMSIAGKLELQQGKIFTAGTRMLVMRESATISGASVDRFVSGPMRKIGDAAFTFPIGNGQQYAPLSISASPTDTADFIAEYFIGNPRTAHGPAFETPAITQMSVLEWWEVDRREGSTPRNITLSVTTYSDATLLEHLRVLRYDGVIWRNEGNIAYTGLAWGPITSQPVSSFAAPGTRTPFSLGSTTSVMNPLRVDFVALEAIHIDENMADLKWTVSNASSTWIRFDIEKNSGDGFKKIGTVTQSGSLHTFRDQFLLVGVQSYRIRLILPDGTQVLSRIVVLVNTKEELVVTRTSPLSKEDYSIFSTVSQSVQLMVIDGQGRVKFQRELNLARGWNKVPVSFSGRSAGVYFIVCITRSGCRYVVKDVF